uniref:quaternary ammonium compound efflux SMR transporter SugE n=1 Tax=Candidatus Laterigemmans baculatus TaxID=2770505 RepID=UPI0013DB810C
MAWLYVLIAGLLEIAWALGLKSSEGFTRFWPSVLTVLGMIASFVFLARGLREIPVGTGYAVWTGIGAAGTAIAGMLIFGESASAARIACIALILIGIIGLKVASG